LAIELLEGRTVPSQVAPTITLDPGNDEFGAQVQTVTQLGNSGRVTLGIFDTGASPITVAVDDQAGFGSPLPVKVAGGGSGDGIGGSVTGDVSQPITILTDGMHAANVGIDFNSLSMNTTANFTSTSAKVAGIQAFIGTTGGSPDMPTISGTPIFAGSFNSNSHSKLAARVDMINGVDTYGVGLLEPDLHFVPATTRLVPGANEFLATIPLGRIGDNTVPAPGDLISSNYNFLSNTVQISNTASNQLYSLSGQKFLLDTGSQMTVVSTAEANALHIDLSHPIDSIDVQGVGGTQTVKGYVIDSLQVGIIGVGPLTFTHVPVFVLDAAPGQIDGILGMNLWNNVDQMLINPFTAFGSTTIPTLSITWDPNYKGATNLGGFGFKIDQLFPGHAQPLTLTRLMGAAAQYFRPPAAAEPASPAPAGEQDAGNASKAPTSTILPAVPSESAPAAAFVQATGSAPTIATLTPAATPVGKVELRSQEVRGQRSEVGHKVVELAASESSASADSGMRPQTSKHAVAAAEGTGASSLEPAVYQLVYDMAAADESNTSQSLELVGTGQVFPLAEAVFLAALALVVRDYCRPDLDERNFSALFEPSPLSR
jgi:hypothetical protein